MSRILPYIHLLRLHRPLPILLLLWPTYWALWIASNGMPPLKILMIFTLGVILMRSVGCIFNDMADHKFDRFVERTKARPLAAGQISLKQALVLAIILSLLAFGLVCLLNKLTIILSFVAILLAWIYPFAKRFTHWPQAVLGLAFNWGIIMAFAAVQNHVPLIAWYLLLIAEFWTLAYDTIYALADRNDDLAIGVKSTAVLFGQQAEFMIGCFQVLVIANLAFLGWILHYNMLFYMIVLLSAFCFVYQHILIRNKQAYIKAFSDNHWVGLFIFIAIALHYGAKI
ncbi:MAG: 4-hydroxybenzoate polyprenyl transferase [Gammaproteobacteria bacterium]|jgi:4-hydroxybenzoate polyprenyltransferase|nr:4-hydroxybenzoate polyprenyl transferase [Gammaproteobacteria bacterium]